MNNGLTHAPTSVQSYPLAEDVLLQGSAADDGSENLLKVITDRLCGRWKYAIPIACLLAVGFGFAGYNAAQEEFESSGIIRVAPNISPIMRQTIETGIMPLYGSFVQTQASLIVSQRVVDRALTSLDLNELPWSTRNEALHAIQSNLSANAARGSELIVVSFKSESPEVAHRVVNAVLVSYDDLYGSADGDEVVRKLQTLRSHRDSLRTQRRQKQAQIQEIIGASDYAVEDFTGLIQQKAMRIQQSDVELRRLQSTLAVAQARGGHETNAEHADDQPRDVTSQMLEGFDQELARLGRIRDQARLEFQRAAERFRPNHRAYVAAAEELRVIERSYDERAELIKQRFLAEGHSPELSGVDELQMRIDYLRAEIEEDRAQAARLNELQLSIADLRAELAELDQDHNEARARIRELEIESESIRTGRITIESRGELPLRPSRDRRKVLAALGVMGGFGAGFGLFFVLGSIDRRAYMAGQLGGVHGETMLLGVLPSLPQGRHRLEASEVAAHCVHQIRNQIEAVRKKSGPTVIAVSSPYQGDGKTSLVLALGASYSASGYKTVLVDSDIVSQSLTYHLMLTGQSGLREALTTGTAQGFVKPLGYKNLSALPTGTISDFGPEMIRRDDLDSIFKQLRSEFDVIIVDTGPLFGSIESLPVASAADGVVLTMRRGRRQSQLDACIRSLRRVRATYYGVVLNHAAHSDCNRYVSTSKVSAEQIVESGGKTASRPARRPANALLRAMNASTEKSGDAKQS